MNKPEERVLDENGFEHLLDVKDVAEKLGIGRNKSTPLFQKAEKNLKVQRVTVDCQI